MFFVKEGYAKRFNFCECFFKAKVLINFGVSLLLQKRTKLFNNEKGGGEEIVSKVLAINKCYTLRVFDSFRQLRVNSQAARKAITHLSGKFLVTVCGDRQTKQFLDQTPYSTKQKLKREDKKKKWQKALATRI